MDSFATAAKLSEIADHAIDMAREKLDERVISMAAQTIINTLNGFDSDHNKMYLRRAIRNTLGDLLASIIKNDKRIRDAFKAAVAHVVGTNNLAKEVAKAVVSDPEILAPAGTFVVKMTDNAASGAFKAKTTAAPPSLFPSGSDSSSSKGKRDFSKTSQENSRKTRHRCKSSSASSVAHMWSPVKSPKGPDVSCRRKEVVDEE